MFFRRKIDVRTATADAFDFNKLGPVDPEDLARFLSSTDATDRRMPIALATQVHDQILAQLTNPRKLDALAMAELRGGLMAMKLFAKAYTFNVTPKATVVQ